MTNILEEEVWPEEQSSAGGKREWTGKRLRAALYTRHGHKAGEHYGKRWLSNRAAAYMGLRRMLGKQQADATADEDGEGATARAGTDRTGGAAEDDDSNAVISLTHSTCEHNKFTSRPSLSRSLEGS